MICLILATIGLATVAFLFCALVYIGLQVTIRGDE